MYLGSKNECEVGLDELDGSETEILDNEDAPQPKMSKECKLIASIAYMMCRFKEKEQRRPR